MGVRGTAAALAAIGVLAGGAAQASIPPSYRVLVVSGDGEARALSEALVQYMSAAGAFARVEPTLYRHQFEDCLAGADFEGCARALIPATEHWQDPAPIVIRAEAAGPGRLAWTCVGSGGRPSSAEAQAVEVDARTALFGEGEARVAQLRAAMDCVQSAALEATAP